MWRSYSKVKCEAQSSHSQKNSLRPGALAVGTIPDGSVSTRNSLPWRKYLKDAEHGGFAHLESIAAFSRMTSLTKDKRTETQMQAMLREVG